MARRYLKARRPRDPRVPPLELFFPVCGFLFAWVLLLGFTIRTPDPEQSEKLVYFSLAAVAPLFAWGAMVRLRADGLLAGTLSMLALLWTVWTASKNRTWLMISVLFAAHAAWMRKNGVRGKREYLAVYAIAILVSALYWPHQHFARMILGEGGRYSLPVLLLLAVLFAYGLTREDRKKAAPAWMLQTGFALLSLPFALHISHFDVQSFSHHWDFFCAPAEMVRAGRWLLHEVPSQYGFGNILLVAWLPAKSTLLSLLYVQAVCLLVTGGCLLAVALRVFPRGPWGTGLAMLSVLAWVYYLPGWLDKLAGPGIFPSVAGFRFFPLYVLGGWLLREAQARMKGEGARVSFVWGGHALWLACVAWSCESGVYATSVWFPGFAWWLVQNGKAVGGNPGRVKLALAPLAMLGLAMALLSVFYRLRGGFFPDWYAYAEYALLYGRGFGAMEVNPYGPVWLLLGLFSFVVFVAVAAWRVKSRWSPALLGVSAGFWVVSSYYTVRSHDNNIINLFPALMFLWLIAACAAGDLWRQGKAFTRRLLVPLCVVSCAMVYARPFFAASVIERVTRLPEAFSHRRFFALHENPEPAVLKLLERANVHPDTPLIYKFLEMATWPSLARFHGLAFPTGPYPQFAILNEERQKQYLDRALAHLPRPSTFYVLHRTDAADKPMWYWDRAKDPAIDRYLQERAVYRRAWVESHWKLEEFALE